MAAAEFSRKGPVRSRGRGSGNVPPNRAGEPGVDVCPTGTLAPGCHPLAPRTPVPTDGAPTPVLLLPHVPQFCSPASAWASAFPGAGSCAVQQEFEPGPAPASSTRFRALREVSGTRGLGTSARCPLSSSPGGYSAKGEGKQPQTLHERRLAARQEEEVGPGWGALLTESAGSTT